ncbi:MAG: hypothetical protein A2V62_04810 [Nitrospirae bacterium RBG_19FT_COMBO_58_9]|nr:MAG: hypothetical protein A2V62_04810 [Nitrospirae bacterium RBG_19FT_COMBO_58_9]
MDPEVESTTVEPATTEAGGVDVAGAAQAGLAPASEEARPVDQTVLAWLLVMANAYRSEGLYRQAMELYWELVEDYPGTPQSDAARTVLLEIALGYGGSGVRHMARSIYERLL